MRPLAAMMMIIHQGMIPATPNARTLQMISRRSAMGSRICPILLT